ncbi:MAG TPA: autotransporter domain-containing protein, partial [Xanthobacteraceae bacterium]
MAAAGLCLVASAALAQDTTWVGVSTDWNTPTNWTPPTIPTGTATFANTGSTSVDNTSGTVTIGTLNFAANAQNYTITINNAFTFTGAGVTNNTASILSQTININGPHTLTFDNASSGNTVEGFSGVDYNVNAGASVQFNNTSSAGTGAADYFNSGTIQFADATTAGNAGFTNGGTITLSSTASAGHATFDNSLNGTITFNQSATGASGIFNNSAGVITFNDSSTAGTTANYTNTSVLALIQFNGTSTAGTASFVNDGGGTIDFAASSTAANATIGNNTGTLTFETQSTAGNANIINNSVITFRNSATAGNATINNAGSIAFLLNTSAGAAAIDNSGQIDFAGSSTAANATITTNSTGTVSFSATSTGGSARLITNAGGTVDISQLTAAGMTAGSIEGAGTYSLGSKQLTVGSLDTSTTVSGQIEDGGTAGGVGGSLDKVGTGTLTLSNPNNTYTGATTIDGGTLTVTGSIASSSGVAINAGATLNGTGLVPAVVVNAGGILMPGAPTNVGTMAGTGNVTFNAGASYQIFINGTTNSKFITTGSASLNAAANVGILNGSTIVVGDKYTILTAATGVTGSFNPSVRFGAFTGTLSQDPDDVFVTFAFNRLGALLPPGAPQNAANVASAIDSFTSTNTSLPPGFQTLLSLPPQQLVNGLLQLDGETSTGAQISGFQLMNQFMALLLDPFTEGRGDGAGPLSFAPVDRQNTFTPEVANAYASVLKAPPAPSYGPWRAWGAAYGGAENVNGAPTTVGSHDITARAGGFAAGLDYRAAPDTRFGFALAGAGTGWDLAQGFGSGHSDAFQAGVYGTHQFGRAYVSGALAFTNFWASTKRVVTVAGADTLEANFDAQSFGA